MPCRALSFLVVALFLVNTAVAQESYVVKAVPPEYDPADAGKPFMTVPLVVEVTVLTDGTPLAFESQLALPHNLVVALSKYRFRTIGSAYKVGIPIEMQIAVPDFAGYRFGRGFKPSWIEAAKKLDAKKALQLEQRLKPDAKSLDDRSALLVWAAGTTDSAGRELRARQIAWLVENQPTAEVLSSKAAFINAQAGQLADPAAYTRIRQLWLDAVAKAPADPKVLKGAFSFLRIEDPQEVRGFLLPLTRWRAETSDWLADTYALAALGITSMDLATEPGTEQPVTIGPEMPKNQFAEFARATLLDSGDLVLVRSAFSSLVGYAKPLIDKGALPEGYAEFCESLANRVRSLQPNADVKCSGRPKGPVELAKRTQFVPPVYPNEAKSRRIDGQVAFTATISKAGKIEHLDTLASPFALYQAARTAVLEWKYQPTKIGGEPVEIMTDIEVNFSLR